MSTLLLLESPLFLNHLLKENYVNGCTTVALNPEMILECEINSIPCTIPEDYFDPIDFFHMSTEFDRETNRFCAEWDEWVRGLDNRFKDLDIYPFKDTFYLWKNILDSVRIKTYELVKIIETVSPNAVYIEDKKQKPFLESRNFIFYLNSMPLYQQICSLMSTKHNNIKVNKFQTKNATGNNKNKSFNSINAKKSFIEKSITKIHSYISAKQIFSKNVSTNSVHIIADRNIPWDIRKELKNRKIDVFEFELNELNRLLLTNNSWKFRDKIEKKIDNYRLIEFGMNIFPIVKPIMFDFLRRIECFIKASIKIKDILNWNDNAVLYLTNSFSSSVYLFAPLFARLLKKNGIKRAALQHGGAFYTTHSPGSEGSDYRYTDIYFIYGSAMKEHFNLYQKKYDIQPIPVGNPIKAKKINRRKIKYRFKKNVLFLPTIISENIFYTGWNSREYTDNSIWKRSCRIIDILSKYQEKYNVIIKAMGGKAGLGWFFKRYLKHNRYNNIDIENVVSFRNIADLSDLTIINYLGGSCPMFEAYHLKADLFIHGTHQLTKAAEEIFNKSFFYYHDENEFLNELDRYLSAGEFYQKDTSEFGKHFCNDDSNKTVGEAVGEYITNNANLMIPIAHDTRG